MTKKEDIDTLKSFNGKGNIRLIINVSRAEWEAKCLRCGYCCRTYNDKGEWTGKYCQHLHFDENQKSTCDIYKNCYGTSFGYYKCVPIEYVNKASPECPYNKFMKSNVEIYRFDGKKYVKGEKK